MMDWITCEDEGLKKDIVGSMVGQIAVHACLTEVAFCCYN